MAWRFLLLSIALLLGGSPPPLSAQEPPLGIALEGFEYPFPVSFFPVRINGEELRVAYMDVAPTGPVNGHAVLLLHGRNFSIELLGADHQGTLSGGISGGGARSTR